MNRRDFIKRGIASAATIEMAGAASLALGESAARNPLPRWKGFNLLDYFLPKPFREHGTTDDDLKWIADWGFDFVRLPMAYPRYLDCPGLNWPTAASECIAVSVVAGTKRHIRSSWRGSRMCSIY